ncbi:MAG: CpaE family protein, partial [Candidatus Limnocylindrales bacterium]
GTLADAWREDDRTGTSHSFAQVAIPHPSGLHVLVLATNPLHTEVLEPTRVADAAAAARAFYDFVILDLHPDFGPLNLALFYLGDRILVPVTPDLPCILAAVQFREVATAMEMRERLVMVMNRANSGVSPSRVERTVALPTLARIRSAGMLFTQASNDGGSVVERYPNSKAASDIERLVDRLIMAIDSGDNRKLSQSPRLGIAESVRNLIGRLTVQR